MDSILQVKNLKKSYKKVVVLNGLNFTVLKGTVMALLGLNGSGKTTLIRIISGLTHVDEGKISLLGKTEKHHAVFDKIGFIFEPYPFDAELSAVKNLRLRCLALDISFKKVSEVLKIVNLNVTRKSVKAFSTGMKQRLALAWALLGDPDFLILDEPFNFLDNNAKKILKDILLNLQKQNKTIMITEHSFADVVEIADEFSILYDGKIISTFSKTELEKSGRSLNILFDEVIVIFIGCEFRGGRIKNTLLSANSRESIYFSKVIVYNIVICIIILFYLLIMTLWNIKGLGLQEIEGMSSFLYFLRCFGIGLLFCITISAVLFLFATIAKNAVIPIVGALGMFFLDLILYANLEWAVAVKIVPSIIIQNMMDINPPKSTVITFFVSTTLIIVISYALSLLIFKRRAYK